MVCNRTVCCRGAFSLVELSIVLVILGLLVGGVLAGQSLIRAAELRAVTTEHNRYLTATQSFRDKYFAIPGDFRDATKFWARQTATTDCVTNSSASVSTPGTCDGDGSGSVDLPNGAGQSQEAFQYWRQLALAGLIEGNYMGTAGSGGSNHSIFGTNVPVSKTSNSGWGILYRPGTGTGDANNYTLTLGNYFIFGSTYANDAPFGANMTPQEAWNIDTKIDDGLPGNGKIIANWRSACTNSASMTDYTSPYKLTETNKVCALFFVRVF